MAGNKLRFEVFKRDLFKCQYCGRTPPDVVLELDHINPKSKGGKGNIDNYITACFECNRGKRDNLLTNIPNTLAEKIPILKEKNLQLKAYNKLSQQLEKERKKPINEICKIYEETFPQHTPTERFRNASIAVFLRKIPFDEVVEAMSIACNKCSKYDALRYFCGICWNKIRQDQEDSQNAE